MMYRSLCIGPYLNCQSHGRPGTNNFDEKIVKDPYGLKQVPPALEFLTLISFVEIHRKALVAFTLETPCVHPVPNNVCIDLL